MPSWTTACLDSITYVGSKPTFEGETRATEVYIFDFDEDIYGQHLTVDFLALVRSDMRFSGVPELIDQMNQRRETRPVRFSPQKNLLNA